MNWTAEVWEVSRVLVFPLVIVIYGLIKNKVDSLTKKMSDLEKEIREQEKKLIYVESTSATKAELAQAMNQINNTLLANNATLEQKIEKIMDLKNAPIQLMLDEIKSKIKN